MGLTTTYFALDVQGLPEVIYTSAGNAYLHLPGVIVTENISGEARYLLSDGLGSVRQAVDETALVVTYREFDPYGNPITNTQLPISNPYGYTGEWWEDEVGLLHLRARWYDPGIGRFISRDPFAGIPDRPYSLHPYQYGYSNPILYTDPSGQVVCLYGKKPDGTCKSRPDWRPEGWPDLPTPFGTVSTVPTVGPTDAVAKMLALVLGYCAYLVSDQLIASWPIVKTIPGPKPAPKIHSPEFELEFFPRYPPGSEWLTRLGQLSDANTAPRRRLDEPAYIFVIPDDLFDILNAEEKAVPAPEFTVYTAKVIQTGGNTLRKKTLKALRLSRDEGKRAIEGLKAEWGKRNDFHSTKIYNTGDVYDSNTGQYLGNLYDYIH